MFFQECSRLVSPIMAMIGMPALSDSVSAVSRLVAPGPSVASQTPGRPETRAQASAMKAPLRSSAISVCCRPIARTAS